MPDPVAAAPPQPDTTSTPPPAAPDSISAIDHAAQEGNFGEFRDARRAVREGKPLPPVDAKKPAASPAATSDPPAPAPAPKKITLSQDELNERTRRAVESAIADDRRTRTATPPSPDASSPAPAPSTEADYKRYLAMPDAPKLDKFESIEEHSAAMSFFIAKKMIAEDRDASQRTERQTHAQLSLQQRDQQFNDRLKTAKDADPDFITKLSPEVRGLKTRDDLGPTDKPGPLNDVADFILRSEVPAQLMRHFTDHPEDLQRFASLANPAAVSFEMGKLHARLTTTELPKSPLPKTITEAPDPATTLGTKPAAPSASDEDNAVAAGDFGAFRVARRDKRAAQHAAR